MRSTLYKNSTLAMITFYCCSISNVIGQDFSVDGNRWYEFEVSIFSQQHAGAIDEILDPDDGLLGYPDNTIRLKQAIDNYMIDFNADQFSLSAEPEFNAQNERRFSPPTELFNRDQPSRIKGVLA